MTLVLICGFAAGGELQLVYCIVGLPDPNAMHRRWTAQGKHKRLFCSCGPIPGLCQGTLAAWRFPGARAPEPAQSRPTTAAASSQPHTHTLRGSSSAFSPHIQTKPSNLKTLFPESDTTKPPFGEGFFPSLFSFFCFP